MSVLVFRAVSDMVKVQTGPKEAVTIAKGGAKAAENVVTQRHY